LLAAMIGGGALAPGHHQASGEVADVTIHVRNPLGTTLTRLQWPLEMAWSVRGDRVESDDETSWPQAFN
jgi:hypothetical protein